MDDLNNALILPGSAELPREAAAVNLFVSLSRLFSQITHWEDLIAGVLQLSISHLHAQCGWFSLYDSHTDEFIIEHLSGISPEIIDDLSVILTTGSMKGGPIIINDLLSHFSEEREGFPSALICYPFHTDNLFLGSLFLCKKKPGSFSEQDQKELEALSFYCEKLVENAILFKNLQQTRDAMDELIEKIHMLEKIKTHLSKFVPTSVTRLIEESPENPRLEKITRDVSVLFLDIVGYTNINQLLDPKDVNFLVETYFSSFLDDIYRNHGDINETAGDGLMILFLENELSTSARHAVDTALAIKKKIYLIGQRFTSHSFSIKVNIGIHSGPALVGSVRFSGKSGDRWTFTASGMTTNISARITDYAQDGIILISQDTAELLNNRYPLKKVGWRKMKNIDKPILIYEIP